MSRAIEILNDDDMGWVRDEEEDFGCLRTPRGALPLERMDVHAHLSGIFVRTVVEQTFVNNFDEPLEATYIFPLPIRAAVSAFRLDVDGRAVVGELKERGAARRAYANAIETGHRAAIAEEERPGVFTMRAGNIMPGERARVRLEIVGQLATRGDEATFHFPLVVAPRYMPGRPLGDNVGSGVSGDTDQVPDASRISPPVLLKGYPNPVRLSLTVDIDPMGLPIRKIKSSLHAVMVDEDEFGDGQVRRIRIMPGERLNRDFILRFSMGQDGVGTGLRLAPDADNPNAGTFALTLVPPRRDSITRKPRDVVFVLDRSGSMGGWKMVAARRAVANMIDSLDYDDHFSVLAFDNTIEGIPGTERRLIRATNRNRYKAVRYLESVDARGGTMMMTPLRTATDLLNDNSATDRVVVLVTDGQVGNEGQIVSLFQQQLNGSRVFTIGIDRAVNGAFLTRLADLGGGGCELVEDEARLDEVMTSIHRRIDTPLWKGLTLSASGFQLHPNTLAPKKIPDVFPGNPVVITGRYTGKAQGGHVDVRAEEQSGSHLTQRVHAKRGGEGLLNKVWARSCIRDLEDAYEAGGSRHGAEEITRISLQHSVMCRFTSFVAVDRNAVVNPGGRQKQVTQAVEQVEGWGQATPKSAVPGSSGTRSRGGGQRKRMPASVATMDSMPSTRGAPDREMRMESPPPAPAKSAAPQRAMYEAPAEFMDGADDLDDDLDDGFDDMAAASFEEERTGEVVVAEMQRAAPAPELDALSSSYGAQDDMDKASVVASEELFVGGRSAPQPTKPKARSGPLGRIVDAGRAILDAGKVESKKEVSSRGNRSRPAAVERPYANRMWQTLMSPAPRGQAEHMDRFRRILELLDEGEARGYADLSGEEIDALAKLAVDLRLILGRGAAATDREVADTVQHASDVLRAISNRLPLPTSGASKPVGRGEEFWR